MLTSRMRKAWTPPSESSGGFVAKGSQLLGAVLPHLDETVQPESMPPWHPCACSSDGSHVGDGKPPTGPVQGPPSPACHGGM